MNRTTLFKQKREDLISEHGENTNYWLNSIKLDNRLFMIEKKLNDVSEQLQAITERLDRMSEHLYYFAKTDDSEVKNAFDDMFAETKEAYKKLFGEEL